VADIPVPPEAVTAEVINKAVRAAGERIGLYKPGNPGFWSTFRIGLETAAPLIAAAERERILALLDAWHCSCGADDCAAYDTRDQIASLIGDAR
jgi:hypothetical protein